MLLIPDLSSKPLSKSCQRLFNLTAFLLGASIPTSIALMNITLGLVVACLLCRCNTRALSKLLMHPLVCLPILMFTLLAVSLLTQSHSYGVDMVGKYKKLLYVLPLALFFLTDRRLMMRFISGFLWANALILVISLAGGLGYFTLWEIDRQNPTVFKLQITQNFFMALAVLLWLMLLFVERGWRRWGYGVLVLLASANVLLMVQGRTGYVALIVGMGVWSLLTLRRRRRLTVFACGIMVIVAMVLVPNRAMERLLVGGQEILCCMQAPARDAFQACDSSMGQRTAFLYEAFALIKRAPLLGNGAGSFWYSNPETGYSVHNPHNEYLLIMVQSGLLGLSVFLVWMWSCYRTAWNMPLACRNLMIAVLSSYMIGHLFNSFLLDSSEGHLFMIISAILASLTLKVGVTARPA